MLVLVTLLSVSVSAAASPSTSSPESTFTWLGELVSVDAGARTMTVKARVAYQEALSELKKFKPAERIWVVWSGVNDSSDAVRQFRRPDTNGTITEPLVMPAELMSSEAPNQYVTLRVKVPDGSLAAIKSVKPGEWVTVTSRQRPAIESEAVVGVKPYSEGATTTTKS
jgi:hypothetical protein